MGQLHVGIDGMLVRQGVSGVETAIYGLAQALARYGRHRYTLFLGDSSPLADVGGDKFETVRCRIPFGSKLFRIIHQYTFLPQLASSCGCDLFHCPGYVSPTPRNVPLVLTVYDLIAFTHPHLCRKQTVINYRTRMPGALRRAQAVVVPSESARSQLLNYFPEAAGRLHIVPLAVDPEFRPEKSPGEMATISNRYGLSTPFILFVGQIEPKKNVPGLVRAYCELRKFGWTKHSLVIAGSRGWEKQDIHALVQSLGIADSVVLTGFVARRDLPALYRSADLFVFPSLCEGFGMPPLEAMACGTPVIVSDRSSLPELVGDCAPTVDPFDIQGMARAVMESLSSAEKLAKACEAGLQRASQFSQERLASETEAVYQWAATAGDKEGKSS